MQKTRTGNMRKRDLGPHDKRPSGHENEFVSGLVKNPKSLSGLGVTERTRLVTFTLQREKKQQRSESKLDL